MENFAFFIFDKIFSTKDNKKALVIILKGDLGSGKTTFTRFFIKNFGIRQYITSPTFVIEKIYKIPNFKINKNHFKKIIHIDAYRLEGGNDMKDLGWDKIVNNPENIILIEWPEKIVDILPKDAKKIEFKFVDEDKREVIY